MGECRTNAEDIRIEPVYGSWELQQVTKVTAVADDEGSLASKYFTISTPTTGYFVWFNTDMDAAPTPADETLVGIEVEIDEDDTAIAVAAAMQAAVGAIVGLHAAVDGCDPTSVYIQSRDSGAVLFEAVDVDTDFEVETLRTGALLELGAFEGDISLGLSESLVDVTSHQTGAQILTALRNGRNIENITLPLLESEVSKLKTFVEASGVKFTPQGGTEVSAWGSEDGKAFDNIATGCRKLVLHPVRRETADRIEDMCFFRAYPLVSDITISGESARVINVEFKIIPDQLLAKDARLFVLGDHTQDFLNTPA